MKGPFDVVEDNMCITYDSHDQLYAVLSFGIFRCNDSLWDTLFLFPSSSINKRTPKQSIQIDKNGTLWVTSAEGMLFRYDGSTATEIYSEDLDTCCITNLFLTSDGELCVFSDRGYYCSVNDNQLVVEAKFDSVTANGKNTVLDYKGNIWFYSIKNREPVLTKSFSACADSCIYYPHVYPGDLTANSHGVLVIWKMSRLSQITVFDYSSGEHQNTSFMSLLGNECTKDNYRTVPGFSVLTEPDGAYYTAFCNTITRHYQGTCETLPPVPERVIHFFRHSDGRLIAGTQNGLFILDDSWWVRVTDLYNMYILELTEDAFGNIWGIMGMGIFHQNGDKWEIINRSNTTLPEGSYYAITPTNDGTIWILVGKTLASTIDGNHWTVYDSTNSILSDNNVHDLYLNKRNQVSVIYSPKSAYDTLNIASFNGARWIQERSIPLHDDLRQNRINSIPPILFFIDSYDDLWIMNFRKCYRFTNCTWIVYDTANCSFIPSVIMGEDKEGTLFFDDFHQSYTFTRDTTGIFLPGNKRHKANKFSYLISSPFHHCVSMDLSITKQGPVSFSLFTLNGQLVKQSKWSHLHPLLLSPHAPMICHCF